MAPAPKSRVPKGKIVEDPPFTSSLIDADPGDGAEPRPDSLPRSSEMSRRRSSVEAPPPRFQLRKQNGAPDVWVTQRGATDEIREHLKHLGPSNLASRPRQTRYHAVKIKHRGGDSPSLSAQTDHESGKSTTDSQRQMPPVSYQGGIGAGLVTPGNEAKDGAHALKLGYGTLNSSDLVTKSTSAQQFKELPQVSIPEPVREEREEREDQARSAPTRQGSSGSGSVKSNDSRPEFMYQHRGPTRSGSITEQIVDVNGIRKVVLHTNGTSSSDGEDKSSPNQTRNSSPGRKGTADSSKDPSNNHQDSSSNAKKRRRRKKRPNQKGHDGGASEEQPLLQQ